MAPSATSPVIVSVINKSKLTQEDLELFKEQSQQTSTENQKKLKVQPLQLKGVLDQYKSFDITPVLGREYREDVQLADLIQAENSDELLRDLAITSNNKLYNSSVSINQKYPQSNQIHRQYLKET